MSGRKLSRRHTYVQLKIADIIDETPDARSFVLEVPRHHTDDFVYESGQFLTIRLRLGLDRYVRCYSMSSAPATGDPLTVTVKRVPGGLVSNFLNDTMKAGYSIESMPPTGDFTLDTSTDTPIVALASGSGITPVMSIIKTALTTTDRPVRLLFGNQARTSIIFGEQLDGLAAQHPGRLEIAHHVYDERGYVAADDVTRFLGTDPEVNVYVCGAPEFTETVREALAGTAVPGERVRYESFTPAVGGDSVAYVEGDPGVDTAAAAAAIAASVTETVNISIRRQTTAVDYMAGDSLLHTARKASLTPPFACEAGHCAACVAFVEEGTAVMTANHALSPEEVEEGWVLTCKAFPTTGSILVEYPD